MHLQVVTHSVLIEKAANISWSHPWSPGVMRSEERRNSIMMLHHYPDLGSVSDWLCHMGNVLQPTRSATQIWVGIHRWYGISVLVSKTSFCGKTRGGITKCQHIFSGFYWHCQCERLGNLSKDIIERRTSTRSEAFSCLTCLY